MRQRAPIALNASRQASKGTSQTSSRAPGDLHLLQVIGGQSSSRESCVRVAVPPGQHCPAVRLLCRGWWRRGVQGWVYRHYQSHLSLIYLGLSSPPNGSFPFHHEPFCCVPVYRTRQHGGLHLHPKCWKAGSRGIIESRACRCRFMVETGER